MQDELELAVGNFLDWDKPWQFRRHVLDRLPSENARRTFESAWNEALNARHWKWGDLANGTSRAFEAVRAGFPGLSNEAVTAIAKAASYEWK